ncbi:hypothetical protein ACFQH2_08795 [Natronoarchaeum sp. GCM10025703]|uniref:hypothetical protein n=1 Tax=Natronoarchaeum sp. GCM10025703 TaxID=3252685 RepID=UPI0036172169
MTRRRQNFRSTVRVARSTTVDSARVIDRTASSVYSSVTLGIPLVSTLASDPSMTVPGSNVAVNWNASASVRNGPANRNWSSTKVRASS